MGTARCRVLAPVVLSALLSVGGPALAAEPPSGAPASAAPASAAPGWPLVEQMPPAQPAPAPPAADPPAPSPEPVAPPAPVSPAPPPSTRPLVAISDPAHRYRYITVGLDTFQLPCRFRLDSGVYPVIVSGRTGFATHLVVPPEGARFEIVSSNPSFRLAGAILVPLGIVVGAGFWAFGFACSYNSSACYIANFTFWPVSGLAMIVAGGVLLGQSNRTPELRRVSPDSRAAATSRQRLRPRLTGLGATPLPSGAAVAASFDF